MPEGPSIVILKDLIEALHLEGKQVLALSGNAKIEKERMLHQQVTEFKSWGKHFMSTITGIHQLDGLLSPEQIQQIDKVAQTHKTQSNISISVLSAIENVIEVETTQGQTKSGKYASEATLIKRSQEVFEKFAPAFQLKVHPTTFLPSPANVVSTSWLEKKMLDKGIRIKQIAFDTGIDRESISDWVTGKRSMSQIVKAMFYFYLSK